MQVYQFFPLLFNAITDLSRAIRHTFNRYHPTSRPTYNIQYIPRLKQDQTVVESYFRTLVSACEGEVVLPNLSRILDS